MFGDIVKMTQASAQTRDEAEGLEALGIDLSTIADLDIDEIRDWCSQHIRERLSDDGAIRHRGRRAGRRHPRGRFRYLAGA